MRPFDTVMVVDWSAAQGVKRAGKDAIWVGIVRDGAVEVPRHFPTRRRVEEWLTARLKEEVSAGRRVIAAFDFPFGYPKGFARVVTGSDDPLLLWDWLAENIEDDAKGRNNRFDVAETLNALFPGIGPFWGKHDRAANPGIPYNGSERHGHGMAERRVCDTEAAASSSCWQLAFPPTVGGQVLTGLPILSRLRRIPGVAVWPFEDWRDAPAILAEIWPGLIEAAVKSAGAGIRDAHQVRMLAGALSRATVDELANWMDVDAPEEGWILGAAHRARLTDLAREADVEEDRIPGTGSDVAPGDVAADESGGSRPAPDLAPPPLADDCFALPPGVEWTPVDVALEHLRAGLRAVVGSERVATEAADGRILAGDAVAARANPPAANSAVDGYGFAHDATRDGANVLPLVDGRAAAGAPFGAAVPAGSAIRILTGAVLPAGVDCVVLEEDTRSDGASVAFTGPVKPRANTRRAGEDVTAGTRALAAGHVLRPPDLALLSAVGLDRVAVFARLRVGVLSTGAELAEPGSTDDPGRTFDANRPMLLAMARRWGHEPVDLGRVGDDRDALRRRLDDAGVDVILTSGGASAGDEDHVSALLKTEGQLQSWRIALKPGRPLALGMWRGCPVFGLPGNPVAAFVCALIFARPALSVLAGGRWSEPMAVSLPAAFAKRKKPGRREFLRARLVAGAVETYPSEGSGRISGLSWADGLVELPEDAAEIVPGSPVRFLPYGGFGLG